MLSLIQFQRADGERGVAALFDGAPPVTLPGVGSTLELAQRACANGKTLTAVVAAERVGVPLDLEAVRLLPPIDHPDPAHLLLTGTGLTHLGSAQERDRMHRNLTDAAQQSDSMKMFLMGVEGGKPLPGEPGAQPEWFFKGNGSCLVGSGEPLESPEFALDAGEEPEIAGIYFIDASGRPSRLGYALANEFSDHITERYNYLWLAHSKLRPAALGPELLVGDLPRHVAGTSRILRNGQIIWQKPFVSGEDNMSHSLANLERHHFKYAQFRRPGDLHVHFFGTGTLSFSDNVQAEAGDVFEIEAQPFRLALRNPLRRAPAQEMWVRAL